MRRVVRETSAILRKLSFRSSPLTETLVRIDGFKAQSHPKHKLYFYLSLVQVSGISREMLLLSNAVEMEDSCWEMRLRCG